MTKISQATGARALQDLDQIKQYLSSAEPRVWIAEIIGSLDASSLDSLLQSLDSVAAQELSSQMLLELSDLFCLIRDRRYANRSRKWLYTRAYKTKALRAYEVWSAFVKENITQDLNTNFLNVDPKSLSSIDYTTLLTLTPNSTKLQQATQYVLDLTLGNK